MEQLEIKVNPVIKKVFPCNVRGCKKLAIEGRGIDGQLYFFCKHGVTQRVEDSYREAAK